ncbi:MAG: YcxB family protein [Methylocystis sp.]|uniref:YcxB family protein n=1 Tax=Methylocystis sp. TaxID=1911079 RepID=UPI003D0CD9D0
MTERYVFLLRYDEKLIRSAVNGFVTRALFRENAARTFVPLALMIFACVMLFFSGEQELGVALFLALSAALAIFVASGWRMHLRIMRGKVDAMRGRWPMARLRDDGVIIDGPGPASLLEWPQIKAIWPVEGAWLLILATNHFITLPLANAPQEALDFLRAHVSPSPVERA